MPKRKMSIAKRPAKRPRNPRFRVMDVLKEAAKQAVPAAVAAATDKFFGGTPTKTFPKYGARWKPKGVHTGRSAGFLKTRRKVYSKKPGASITLERGGILDTKIGGEAGPTVFVGHATAPLESTLKLVCIEIVRCLIRKVGKPIVGLDDSLDLTSSSTLENGVYLHYKPDSRITTTSTFTAFQINNASSINTIANDMQTWLLGCGLQDQIQVTGMEYRIQTNDAQYPRTWIYLEKSTITLYSKSSLKMQNRSVEAEGDGEADDVDNVPLYGKSYSGTGNGCQHVSKSGPTNFTSDDIFGDIWKQDTRFANGNLALREPPKPQDFEGVKKHDKARIEPGQIKTSVLVFKKTVTVSNMVRILLRDDLQSFSQSYSPSVGNFRLFCFEKMLQIKTNADDLGIKLAYEVNLFTQVTATIRDNMNTLQQVRVGNVNTTIH